MKINAKPPTVKEVAARAGVSVATVSLVLNDYDKITPATRQKVFKAAKELNYNLNAVAQSLRTQKSGILGLILPSITNPFYPSLAQGVDEAAEAGGYSVFLSNSENNSEKEQKYINLMLQKRVEGIIIAGTINEPTVSSIREQENTKFISLVANSKLKNADFLVTDNNQGGYLVTRHLLDLGHRRIAFLGRRITRLNGYERAFAEHGLEVDPGLLFLFEKGIVSASGDYFIEIGYSITKEIVNKRPDFTGLFAYNDLLALGALKALKELKIKVPEEVSVVGYDNIPFAKLSDPRLTSVEQSQYQRGKDAVNRLLERIRGERTEPLKILYQPQLVVRETTAPPRDRALL